jgi:hypothetical protein
VTVAQLPSLEEAEQWAAAMQNTRVELEQKLRDERAAAIALLRRQEETSEEEARVKARGVAAAAQTQADAAAETLVRRPEDQSSLQDERNASQEAERSDLCDVMARVQSLQARLRKLKEDEIESTLQEERLALELEQLRQKSQTFLKTPQQHPVDTASSAEAASSAFISETALSNLPHDLTLRVNAVLDKASGAVRLILC